MDENQTYGDVVIDEESTYETEQYEDSTKTSKLPTIGAAAVCIAIGAGAVCGIRKLVKHFKKKKAQETEMVETELVDECESDESKSKKSKK